jgi:endonuclease YncB( thermonuclease family)
VSKPKQPARQGVALRPSRIRREPLRIEPLQKKAEPPSPERDIWFGVAGVVLFALIIACVTVGFSAITGHGDSAGAKPVNVDQFGRCDVGDQPNCVIDGETIQIAGKTVKIAGIEAPKIRSAGCAQEAERGGEAVEGLLAILNGGPVAAAGDVREPDGQVRTKVEVDGRDVGVAMINAGLARTYGSDPSWCD